LRSLIASTESPAAGGDFGTGRSPSRGPLIGGIFGSLFGLILLAAIILFFIWRRRKEEHYSVESCTNTAEMDDWSEFTSTAFEPELFAEYENMLDPEAHAGTFDNDAFDEGVDLSMMDFSQTLW
jgi:uncharacterized membrane protein